MNKSIEQLQNQKLAKIQEQLSKKSIPQLTRMIKNRNSPNYDIIRDYYDFRDFFLFKEAVIKSKCKKLKGKIDRASAPDRDTWFRMKEDYKRMQDDISWIRNVFFELPEESRKTPPHRDFHRSEFV